MMTINEKETSPIKMDDKLLNGTFRKDGSLATNNGTCLESADRWFLGRILKTIQEMHSVHVEKNTIFQDNFWK